MRSRFLLSLLILLLVPVFVMPTQAQTALDRSEPTTKIVLDVPQFIGDFYQGFGEFHEPYGWGTGQWVYPQGQRLTFSWIAYVYADRDFDKGGVIIYLSDGPTTGDLLAIERISKNETSRKWLTSYELEKHRTLIIINQEWFGKTQAERSHRVALDKFVTTLNKADCADSVVVTHYFPD